MVSTDIFAFFIPVDNKMEGARFSQSRFICLKETAASCKSSIPCMKTELLKQVVSRVSGRRVIFRAEGPHTTERCQLTIKAISHGAGLGPCRLPSRGGRSDQRPNMSIILPANSPWEANRSHESERNATLFFFFFNSPSHQSRFSKQA
jgi:hypothetical protein